MICSRKFHISSAQTLEIAEKLYQQGLFPSVLASASISFAFRIISYPRTETSKYNESMDLRGLVQEQVASPHWGGFASQILARGPSPRNGNQSDEAHPPIHPTKYVSNLDGLSWKVYEVVVRSFLACLSWDAKGNETVVSVELAGEEVSFYFRVLVGHTQIIGLVHGDRSHRYGPRILYCSHI